MSKIYTETLVWDELYSIARKPLAGSLHPGHNSKISIETHRTVRLIEQFRKGDSFHTSQSRAVNLE